MNLLDPKAVVAAADAHGAQWERKEGYKHIFYIEGCNLDGSPNDNRIDLWNDIRGIIEFVNGEPQLIFKCQATTVPGVYYDRQHIIGWGGKAAALIALGRQACWQVGFHQDDPEHECLRQTGAPCTVYRDIDRNLTRKPGYEQTGWFGINEHGPGNVADGSPSSIGPHSAGCLVARVMDEHREFMRVVKTDPRYLADHKHIFDTIVMAREWIAPEATTQPQVSNVPNYHSMVPGGYFATPDDKSLPLSIRTNNPGAINGAAWEQQFPGYIGTIEGTAGNKTTIFETPEVGVAVWWELLRKYRSAGATTVGQIVNRYGGGQDYSAYVQFVVNKTGLSAHTEIVLDDDATLLKFGKAMFWYEAGRQTPLHDDQIVYGFNLARNLAFGTPIVQPEPDPVPEQPTQPPQYLPPAPRPTGITKEQIDLLVALGAAGYKLSQSPQGKSLLSGLGKLLPSIGIPETAIVAITGLLLGIETQFISPEIVALAIPPVAAVGLIALLQRYKPAKGKTDASQSNS